MDSKQGAEPESALGAWRVHESHSSGSERSAEPSSRGSSSIDEYNREMQRIYRRQSMLLEQTRQEMMQKEEEIEKDQEDADDDSEDIKDDNSPSHAHPPDDEDEYEDTSSESEQSESSDGHSDDNEADSTSPADPSDVTSPAARTVIDPFSDHIHSPRPQRKYRLAVTAPYEAARLPLYDHSSHIPPQYLYPYPPAWQHSPGQQQLPHYAYPPSFPFPEAPEPPRRRRPRKMRKLGGYELLASELAKTSSSGRAEASGTREPVPAPLYRTFQALNHRTLLHLQDEIVEMEEELNALDEELNSPSPVRAGARPSSMSESSFDDLSDDEEDDLATQDVPPASRRVEARLGGELHFRRTELLGRIFIKMGQYHQALSSHGSARHKFPAAAASEITSYQAWMDRHQPVESPERQFLEYDDLISVARLKSDAPIGQTVDSGIHGSETAGPRSSQGTTSSLNVADAIRLCLAMSLPMLLFASNLWYDILTEQPAVDRRLVYALLFSSVPLVYWLFASALLKPAASQSVLSEPQTKVLPERPKQEPKAESIAIEDESQHGHASEQLTDPEASRAQLSPPHPSTSCPRWYNDVPILHPLIKLPPVLLGAPGLGVLLIALPVRGWLNDEWVDYVLVLACVTLFTEAVQLWTDLSLHYLRISVAHAALDKSRATELCVLALSFCLASPVLVHKLRNESNDISVRYIVMLMLPQALVLSAIVGLFSIKAPETTEKPRASDSDSGSDSGGHSDSDCDSDSDSMEVKEAPPVRTEALVDQQTPETRSCPITMAQESTNPQSEPS